MDRSLADQMVWDFEDNRSDIAVLEEVLRMLKITHCDSVGGEQIGSYSDEGANTRLDGT